MKRTTFVLAVAAVVVLGAAPAWAHVEWEPEEATTGGPAQLHLHVPNERDDAATIQVELVFPEGHQLADVVVPPIDGWAATVEGAPAVTAIVWKATGAGLTGDEEIELPVAIGTVYGDGGGQALVFKALQTYSDGAVERWIEETPPGGEEPEHPAPVLTLRGPAVAAPAAASTSSTAEDAVNRPVAGNRSTDPDDDSGGAPLGLLVAIFLVAAVMTTVVVARRNKRGDAPASD